MLSRGVVIRSFLQGLSFNRCKISQAFKPHLINLNLESSKTCSFSCTSFARFCSTKMASAGSSMSPDEKYELINRNLQVNTVKMTIFVAQCDLF